MKKVLAYLLISVVTIGFAQEKELKEATKLVKKKKYNQALAKLKTINVNLKGTDYESQSVLLKSKALFAGGGKQAKLVPALKNAYKVLDIDFNNSKEKMSKDAIEMINEIELRFGKQTQKALKVKNFQQIADINMRLYEARPDIVTPLINAAVGYQQAKMDGKLVTVSEKILKTGYPWKKTFSATRVFNQREDIFKNKKLRDKAVHEGTHNNPKEEVLEANTRLGYYNVLTRVYGERKESEKQIEVLKKAIVEFPKNKNLALNYANKLYEQGNEQGYIKALNGVLQIDDQDAGIWYNLGVVNQKMKRNSRAINAYNKAIAIDPKNRNAYVNKGILILDKEQSIVDEINANLRDKAKVKELETKLNNTYKTAVRLFEKAQEIKKDDGLQGSIDQLNKSIK